MHNKVKRIVLLSLLATILFVQEEALTFLPNIQLTVFLIVLYTKTLGLKDISIILVIHVLLDNLVMGSFNPIYILTMYIGWLLTAVLVNTYNGNNELILAMLGLTGAFIYSWVYLIPNTFIYKMPLIPYLKADLLFECILGLSSFISIYLLYKPVSNVFQQLLKKYGLNKKTD